MADDQKTSLKRDLVRWGRSLFQRGLTAGSSGNISIRFENGFLATPTNSCLGFLEEGRIAELDSHGKHLSGDPPTKELSMHLAFYENRPHARAVVHLHSTYATLLSCLADIDASDAIPPITPYVVMRVGRVAVLHPYIRPGSPEIAQLVRAVAPESAAVLLANHGPVVSGPSLESAIFAAEELEETAKLVFLSRGSSVRHLAPEAVAELKSIFRRK